MSTAYRKPPHVPSDFPTLRYFQPGHSGMEVTGKSYVPTHALRVVRHATDDYAQLSMCIGHLGEMTAEMDTAELRSIAAALLDAAHDIETNPAASMRQQAAAGTPPQPLDPDTEAFAAGEQQVSTR